MLEFTVNKKSNCIPGSFSEFKKEHWSWFVKSLGNHKIQSWHDIKVSYLKKFSNIPFSKLSRLLRSKKITDREEFANHDSKLFPIYEKLNFLSKRFEFSENQVKYLRYGFLGFKKLYPPNNDLSNLKTWEMAFATKYSKDYSHLASLEDAEKHSEELKITLDKLIVTIYRPSYPFWKFLRKYGYHPFDRRRKFHDSLISFWLPKIKKVPDFKKTMILFWFNSAYKRFSEQFREIINETSGETPDNFSWADMIVTCENSIPGDEEKIGDSYATMFLRRLVAHKNMIDNIKSKSKPK